MMRTSTIMLAALLAAALLSAQDPTLLTSYQEARRVIDRAVAATGGLERLRTIRNVTVRFEGELVHRNQSRSPEPPYDRTPNRSLLAHDSAGGRLRFDNEGSWVGGFDWSNRLMTDGKTGRWFDVLRRYEFPMDSPALSNQQMTMRRLPHVVLLEALDHARTLRHLGTNTIDGRPHEIVAMAGSDDRLLQLYLDGRSGLLTKFEWLEADPTGGDVFNGNRFDGYRTVEGVQVPSRRSAFIDRELVADARITDVKIDGTDAELGVLFAPPEGYAPGPQPPPNAPPVTTLAERVWLVRASPFYNVLVVSFTDHVLVVETPGDDQLSRQVMARVKEVAPGKPVRYVAVTHHHDDHAGGARAWLAEGATLVTTAGNRGLFERMARRSSTLEGDRPIPLPKIETFSGRRVLEDAVMRVELVDIGEGPHTKEMVVAYLPGQRLLFQGDLLNRPADGRPQPGNLTTRHFAERIQALGLNVDRVAAVHGPTSTRAELDQATAASPVSNH